MSFAIVTPSLMMVGLPKDLSNTTVLALGPNVTLIASAAALIPSNNFFLASSPYIICLAIFNLT